MSFLTFYLIVAFFDLCFAALIGWMIWNEDADPVTPKQVLLATAVALVASFAPFLNVLAGALGLFGFIGAWFDDKCKESWWNKDLKQATQ